MKKYIFGGTIGLVVIVVCGAWRLFPYRFQTPAPQVRYDNEGKAIIGYKQEPWASFDDIPSPVVEVVVGVEDKRFRWHPWIDPIAVWRALWLYSQGVRPLQGASTIDQQLIKLDRATFHRTWAAKRQENRWALMLQFSFSKKDIVLRYVNNSPFSHGIVGRNAACKAYRWQSCAHVDLAHLLFLLVTTQLGANPYREDDFAKIIQRANLFVRAYPKLFSGVALDDKQLRDDLQSFPAPLDPRVQDHLINTTSGWMTTYDLWLSMSLDTLLKRIKPQTDQYGIGDCCVIVIDGDGSLLSMNMCRPRDDTAGWKVNSCVVPRQTGSAIKPFLYLYAFHVLWRTQHDMVVDEPVQFDLGDGNLYDPKNFDLTYHGEVTYAYALGNSLNVPAVKTLQEVGVWAFLWFLKEQASRVAPWFPLNPKTADDVGLSLALGTYELSPWQFVQLWRLFLPQWVPPGYEQQRKDIVDILSNPLNKMVSFGQDSFLATPGRAVKTWTSRKFVDGRICGGEPPLTPPFKKGGESPSTPSWLLICIWLGNQTNEPMLGASSEVGSYLRKLVVEAVEK